MKNSILALLLTIMASIYLMYVGFCIIGAGVLSKIIEKEIKKNEFNTCIKIKSAVECRKDERS
jgi:uncharacterized protein YneF (UPF0154 family)